MKFEKEVMQNLAMVTQLGISMLAPIILCVFAGHWLDEHFGFHSVIVLLLFGIAAGYGASAVGRNPGAKGDIMSTMLLGQAVAETTGLYGLAIAFILLFANPLIGKL